MKEIKKSKKIIEGEESEDEDDDEYEPPKNKGGVTASASVVPVQPSPAISTSKIATVVNEEKEKHEEIVEEDGRKDNQNVNSINTSNNVSSPAISTSSSSSSSLPQNTITTTTTTNTTDNNNNTEILDSGIIVGRDSLKNSRQDIPQHYSLDTSPITSHSSPTSALRVQSPQSSQFQRPSLSSQTRTPLSLGEGQLKQLNESLRKTMVAKSYTVFSSINRELVNTNNNLISVLDITKAIQQNIRSFNDDILTLSDRLEQTEWSLQC